jgi:hypothetical protein
MGVVQDRPSRARILFAVFTHKNATRGVSAPFPLTRNA